MAAVIPSPCGSVEEETICTKIASENFLKETTQNSHSGWKKTTLKHFTFDCEPSKVESQLKENIQKLNTPSEDTVRKLIPSSCDVQCDQSVTGTHHDWEIPFQDIRELEYVGSGGQGTVFKGVHRGAMVAVKKVNDPKQTNIHHLRKLEHSNIIKFLGVCTKEPCYCVVMEYCCGGNVYQYIRRPNIIMLPKLVVNWARQIASGMEYLHANHIVHRDLKSLNVLVKKDGYLKITDFGTSRLIDNHSTVMTVIGSCAWMAPELIRNEKCNDKVDVWSYGILLWELLTQEIPYKGLNHGAIMFGVGSNRLSLPIPGKCPDELKTLLNKCWQPKAKNRPSFKQILGHLDWVREGKFLTYSTQDYMTIRALWKEEIDNHFETLELDFNSQSNDDYELVMQRTEELKHALEVRMMYEKKLETAKKLCEQLDQCKRLMDQRETELRRRERDFNELYKELYYSSTTTSDDEDIKCKTVTRRKMKKFSGNRAVSALGASKSSNQKDSSSTPDVFDSPVESSPIPIPMGNISFPNGSSLTDSVYNCKPVSCGNSPQLESIITDEGNVSPAVQKLINSVTQSRTSPSQPCHMPHPARRHRRAHSCSSRPSLRRKGSKSSVKSLNFYRKAGAGRDQSPADYHYDNTCTDDKRLPVNHKKKHIRRSRSISDVKDTQDGLLGDTESNEDEEDDQGIGEDPAATTSISTVPVQNLFTKQHISSPAAATVMFIQQHQHQQQQQQQSSSSSHGVKSILTRILRRNY